MLKWFNLILLGMSIAALVGVYYIKYQSIDTGNEKIALEQLIKENQNDLSSLKADWAYLNQPKFIEPILIRHKDALGLRLTEQNQFISIADLPDRIVGELDKEALTLLFEAVEKGVDPIALLIEANSQ